ncbi:hypothetical protein [Fusobacterium mortiferum]|uniref:Uncharacterized protein n=1 Tax=Fusobacterium mortiferum ATCC 9817 TaxID=469616 RepID=A0ABM6TXS8_FUSMR|nr:hypothetical protein [Fusobacterium mortiferum]AVQ19235.1 hypothetical protein C4N19_09075 [Fusobacterium mortiferum ATCC 9817]EEO36362.1 hypothetical protein FMAG_01924 [Fusobacterium mortiferum ATCC 9817]
MTLKEKRKKYLEEELKNREIDIKFFIASICEEIKNKKEHMEEWYIKTGEENYSVSVYDKDIKSVDDDILDRLKKEVNSIEFEEYYITYNSFNDNGRLYKVYFSINFKSEDKENVISQNKKKSLFDKIRSWLYEQTSKEKRN